MKRAKRAGLISEQSIKDALGDAKGDIFLASTALDCTAQELDRYIRASAELQNFAVSIETVKSDPGYARMSSEQFEAKLADLSRAYRVVGVEEIHRLATMSHKGSAAMAKVKLQAAIALRGGEHMSAGDREIEHALTELNQLYQQNAPRIKEIRQTTITFQDDQRATQPVIELPRDQL